MWCVTFCQVWDWKVPFLFFENFRLKTFALKINIVRRMHLLQGLTPTCFEKLPQGLTPTFLTPCVCDVCLHKWEVYQSCIDTCLYVTCTNEKWTQWSWHTLVSWLVFRRKNLVCDRLENHERSNLFLWRGICVYEGESKGFWLKMIGAPLRKKLENHEKTNLCFWRGKCAHEGQK